MNIVFALVIGFLAVFGFLLFMGSRKGMEIISRQSERTILRVVKAIHEREPWKTFPEIYKAIAQERYQRSWFLRDMPYLKVLEEMGCFDKARNISPEDFAMAVAKLEDKLKRIKAGGEPLF